MRKILSLLMAVLFAGSLMATEYTYTDFATTFNRGTTKTGTDISGAISTTTTMATLAASGATNFSGVEAVANCYYNANGVGLRLAKSGGAGSLTLTLSDALKDSTISAIVVYASKVSGCRKMRTRAAFWRRRSFRNTRAKSRGSGSRWSRGSPKRRTRCISGLWRR